MKTKEEVIKEAWGEAWEFAKNYVDDYGFVYGRFQYDYPQFNYDNFEGYEVIRPLSLRGLEDNNGWIKIESEEDLPDEDGLECYIIGKYHDAFPLIAVFDSRHGDGKRFYNMNGDLWSKDVITHYQPIIKPKPPLY